MNILESEKILKSIKNADGIIIRWPKKNEDMMKDMKAK